MAKHKVLAEGGLFYPDGKGGERHAKQGAIVSDIPAKSVKWLTTDGLIEPEGGSKPEPKSKKTKDGEN